MQAALTAWIEKAGTPKLVSLDKKAVNNKALGAIFSKNEIPKVIGVLDIESPEISDFQSKLIKLGEDHSDLHVRLLTLSCYVSAFDHAASCSWATASCSFLCMVVVPTLATCNLCSFLEWND